VFPDQLAVELRAVLGQKRAEYSHAKLCHSERSRGISNFFYGFSSRAAKTARDLIFGLGTHKLVRVIHDLVRGPSHSLGMTEIISRRFLQNRARFFLPESKMR